MQTVKVTNRAGRWICVRIGNGRTLRLGPRETSEELPAHCSMAPELRVLCAKGVLTVHDTEPLRVPSSAQPAEESHEESHESGREATEPREPQETDAAGGATRCRPI